MESVLPAAGFLYWVGAGTVAYLALRVSCSLFTALRVWVLDHEAGVGPKLGEWAGESDPVLPAPWLLHRLVRAWLALTGSGPSAWPSTRQLSSPFPQGACTPRAGLTSIASSGMPRLVEF
ncbi:Very-long-chain 3-oxoacyl-CoA reductase [Galemys pyrenaicus]|uniref:Very-long-chain 3-oxoacyl-CoA reductase n=1 Tax=Galemys pyrenaicus TaxID=202257 RepID=A0A8J5ZVI8_GALPY|nr:Very-long-chain 3-oxoacyl-CoA reductase [Galemys pyrenaicus]